MYRMFTLIWALGVVFYASHAQAVTPMGDKVGSAGTARMHYNGQKSQQAHRPKRHSRSSHATRHRARVAVHKKRIQRSHTQSYSYRAAQPRKVSHRAKRRTRTVEARQVRPRRITESRAVAAKPTRRAARTRQREARSAPVGTTLSGIASYYWQPQKVASGGWFNPRAMTAAHKTLPFGTRVKVTNARNGRTVEVTINDRGPYIAGRIIDLSDAAAGVIGMKSAGVVPVKLEVVGR